MFTVLAVDGGAGTGKSTLSKLISSRKNFLYVETGSHYRALTFILLEKALNAESVEDYLTKNPLIIESNINKNKSEIQIDGIRFNSEDLRSTTVNENVFTSQQYPYSENHFLITRDLKLIRPNHWDFQV